jgi:hypothetical protein
VSPAARPTFEYVSPDALRFDPTNPRFGGQQARSQDAVQALLEREPHFALQLVDSFLENGFIDYEPLVVRRDGDNYVVVEGNRRLAAIRHIRANLDKFATRSQRLNDLNSIPVLVFPNAVGEQERKEQMVYLGVRHLFGFREWPPDSKAKFLDLQIRNADDLERVSKELNIRRTEIRRYLVPFRLRKQAKDLWEPYKDQDFWLFGEGLSRAGIKEYLGLKVDSKTFQVKDFAPKKLKYLLEFLYGAPRDRRITETRNLSALARTLSSPAAAEELEKGRPIEQAQLFIESSEESIERLKRLVTETGLLLRKILSRQQKLKPLVAPVLQTFGEFESSAKRFIKDAKKSNV